MARTVLSSLLDCFRCCGPRADQSGDHVLQPLNLYNPRAHTSVAQLIEQSAEAREALFARLGEVQAGALTHAAEAGLVGAPRWPAQRQAFRVVRRPGGMLMIVSDGLSDPFDDLQAEGNVAGFGLEFFVLTPEAELPGASAGEVKQSWQFQLLYTVCSLAAGHGGIRNIIDDMGLLSTEAEGVAGAMPEGGRAAHVNRAGRVGALLGLTAPGVPELVEGMPLTSARLVNVKLLTLAELRLITERGAEGRRKLGELFGEGEGRLVSSLERESAL
jgi:hypothetical protein